MTRRHPQHQEQGARVFVTGPRPRQIASGGLAPGVQPETNYAHITVVDFR